MTPPTKPRTKAITYCAVCGVTHSARRKWCECGAPVTEGTAPAWLTCGHCGDEAVESASGLFWDDEAGPCMTCGMPGHVEVGDDSARWSTDDDVDGNVCKQADCTECREHESARRAVSP